MRPSPRSEGAVNGAPGSRIEGRSVRTAVVARGR
nr:MAG TPA: hypothetical protein [Caudoviricetes sp.]